MDSVSQVMLENKFVRLNFVVRVIVNVCMAQHRFAETACISAASQIIHVIAVIIPNSILNHGVVYLHVQIVDQIDTGINVKVNVFVMLVVQVHSQAIEIVHVVQGLIGLRSVVYKFHNQIQDQMMMIMEDHQDQAHHLQRLQYQHQHQRQHQKAIENEEKKEIKK